MKNEPDARMRETYGKRAGYLSIAFNLLLAGGKMAVGLLFGMISVLADGLNNLTDCGSNAVSVIGFKMSGKPADKEHPFGHQRAEYVATMVIALIILAVALELLIQSVREIVAPTASEFSIVTIAVLAASIVVKAGMFVLNRSWGKKICSDTLRATAVDSLSDMVATAAVLAALLISHYTNVYLDGYAGAAVALFIGFEGGSIMKDTISSLLGKALDQESVRKIEERVLSFAGVHGVHDLTVHNYGENKLYATVHVEVDADMPIVAAHDLADEIERSFADETNISMTVHIDPLVLNDPRVNAYRERVEAAVRAIDERFRIHDFRVVGGENHSNLIFDLAVPFDCRIDEDKIIEQIVADKSFRGENVDFVITVEKQNSD